MLNRNNLWFRNIDCLLKKCKLKADPNEESWWSIFSRSQRTFSLNKWEGIQAKEPITHQDISYAWHKFSIKSSNRCAVTWTGWNLKAFKWTGRLQISWRILLWFYFGFISNVLFIVPFKMLSSTCKKQPILLHI